MNGEKHLHNSHQSGDGPSAAPADNIMLIIMIELHVIVQKMKRENAEWHDARRKGNWITSVVTETIRSDRRKEWRRSTIQAVYTLGT